MLNRLKEFFGFNKKELNGLLVFCFLMLVVIVAPLFPWKTSGPSDNDQSFKNEIAAFKASLRDRPHRHSFDFNGKERTSYKKSVERAHYFHFNPNHLSVAGWQELGLKEGQIRVIKNYEASGATFRTKEDLKRVYSISNTDYARLEPYIDLPDKSSGGQWHRLKYFRPAGLRRPRILVDINSADSALLETISGIGPVLASRIVRYRERLGGFYRKDQLMEIYGIDSTRYLGLKDQLSVSPFTLRKLNVNTATFSDLKRHPYLTYKQMNAIIQYRRQHGPYRTVDDLKKIVILNEEILRKIAPYLIFND